jgi:hypothetical protein
VQAARDARALQGLLGRELVADGHQTGHLGLGDLDFLAAPFGQRKVGNGVVAGMQRLQNGIHGQTPVNGDEPAAQAWETKSGVLIHSPTDRTGG